MQSKKKTTVAVLRTLLGLTVEEFAKLIGKSLTTVNSLETGRLKLSEKTAHTISQETGVEMHWLLKSKPKEKPYVFDESDGLNRPYTKEVFEIAQARKKVEAPIEHNPDRLLVSALQSVAQWISIYTSAVQSGKGYLADYLMSQFLNDLGQRLGQDTDAVLKMNKNSRVIANDGSQWFFTAYSNHLRLFEDRIGAKAR